MRRIECGNSAIEIREYYVRRKREIAPVKIRDSLFGGERRRRWRGAAVAMPIWLLLLLRSIQISEVSARRQMENVEEAEHRDPRERKCLF